MAQDLVANVSDTARWVAVYRAQESARADALFRDPYADRLAGERGRAIAAVAPVQMRSGWPMVVRTKLIDDLVATSIAEGCDTVLSLAAGLDTRPYRLALPQDLRWIEADLPGIVEEKERLLAGEKPVCRLSREKVDLADPAARAAFLDRVLAPSKMALVITEGLLVYLDEEVIRALAKDFLARPAIRFWMFDISSPAILTMIQKGMGRHLDNSPMKFAPRDGVAFFEKLGWKAKDIRSFVKAALEFKRGPAFFRWIVPFFPEPNPRDPKGRWGAVVRLEK
jgi:methyltransferase (TIGR00027 family)